MQTIPIPLLVTMILTAACILYSFFYGLLTRNYSSVDRLWSVLPAVYVLIWLPGFIGSPRFIIAGVIVIAWAVRLSRNFAVKGGFKVDKGRFTGEDYRWEVMRKKIPGRVVFEIFNFFFISHFQLVLIFAFTFPLYLAGTSYKPLGAGDIALFAIHALLLIMETVADEQQFAYYRKRGNSDDPRMALGFNTFGLWKYSRHPNYVCEMGQWIAVSLYPLTAGLAWFPSGSAVIVLILLFIGSTILAEGITSGKYPAYAAWKKATPAWIPLTLPFRRKARKDFWTSADTA